ACGLMGRNARPKRQERLGQERPQLARKIGHRFERLRTPRQKPTRDLLGPQGWLPMLREPCAQGFVGLVEDRRQRRRADRRQCLNGHVRIVRRYASEGKQTLNVPDRVGGGDWLTAAETNATAFRPGAATIDRPYPRLPDRISRSG